MKYTQEMILQSQSGYCMPFEERENEVEMILGYGKQPHPETDKGHEFLNTELIDSDKNTFTAGLEDKDRVVLKSDFFIPTERKELYLNDYFTRLFNSNITINDPGDSNAMYVCVYLPLYDKKAWIQTLDLLNAVDEIPQRYYIDLSLFKTFLFLLFLTVLFLFYDCLNAFVFLCARSTVYFSNPSVISTISH